MEETSVNNVINEAVEALPVVAEKSKPNGLTIGVLTFATIGVVSTGYFLWKGGKWVINKAKSLPPKNAEKKVEEKKEAAPKAAEEPKKAPEEPKAEEKKAE